MFRSISLTADLKKAGISWPYTEEFAIKRPEDIAVVGYIFEEEFYYHRHDKITIFGGIPSNILIPTVTGNDEFEAFMDNLFKVLGIEGGIFADNAFEHD